MRKFIFLLTLVLIFSPVLAFNVKIINQTNLANIGGNATFTLQLISNKPYNETIHVGYLGSWSFDVYPSSNFNLISGSNKTINVVIYIPTNPDEIGIFTDQVIRFNQRIEVSSGSQYERVPIYIDVKGTKVSNFKILNINFNKSVDPRKIQTLELIVSNNMNRDVYPTLKLRVLDENGTEVMSLKDYGDFKSNALSNTTQKFNLDLSSLNPGEYNLEVNLYVGSQLVERRNILFNVIRYSDVNLHYSIGENLFGKTYIFTITNNGTGNQSKYTFSVPLSFLEYMLSDKTGTYFNNKVYFVINNIPANEVIVFTYNISYLPLIIAPFLVILTVYLVWWYTKKLVIKKRVIHYNVNNDSFEAKIIIYLKNKTNKVIRNVVVEELVSPFVSKVKVMKTLEPDIKETKKGKKIVWKIPEINPKEERVIMYTLKTKVGLVGNITFESTKVKYKFDNKLIVDYSNSVTVGKE